MKIRTDFVTNSSSSSYTIVEVRNQVLCELLRKYKKKLGLGSVSKDTVELVPFTYHDYVPDELVEYPESYDEAVSEVWDILDNWKEKEPELYQRLINARDDINACFECLLFVSGYNEYGGDSVSRYEWEFDDDTTEEEIAESATMEGVYSYYSNPKTGEAEEFKVVRTHTCIYPDVVATRGFRFSRNIHPECHTAAPVMAANVNIEEIAKKYKETKTNIPITEEMNPLIVGKNFVVTGDVYKFKDRPALKTYIEENGGKLTGAVSSKTDYLINNDATSTTSKNLAAKKNNIPIITEDEFIEKFNVQIS